MSMVRAPMPRAGLLMMRAQAQVIGRVVDHAQVGQHILDLRPIEEPSAADDAVGDAVALEGVLHGVGLGVHPVEHRVVLPLPPLLNAGDDLGGHILRLVRLVHRHIQADLIPCPLLRPQLLALAPLVVLDDGVGCVQDVLGGAVVLLQPDDPSALVLLLEGEDILNGSAAEAINGLVVVAHHADVLPLPRQGGRQQVLQVVGVLVFVDEDVAELVLLILPCLLVFQEQADGM